MWEVIPIMLCLGVSSVPTGDCIAITDMFGPYMTEEQCTDRARVMVQTAPALFAQGRSWPGPVTSFQQRPSCLFLDGGI